MGSRRWQEKDIVSKEMFPGMSAAKMGLFFHFQTPLKRPEPATSRKSG